LLSKRCGQGVRLIWEADVGETYTMDGTGIVREIAARVGPLSEDEAALVRTLSPVDQPEAAKVEHRLDLVDLLTTIREDQAMAEYVYAIAPRWDGTIETLLLGGRVTTAFARIELESCGVAAAATIATATATGRRVPARRRDQRRVPAPVG
jgi:hypothetical protein